MKTVFLANRSPSSLSYVVFKGRLGFYITNPLSHELPISVPRFSYFETSSARSVIHFISQSAMAQVFDPRVSYMMSRIRKVNSKPEIVVRKFLFSKGYRFRIHVHKLVGNPDIVLRKYKTVIFVNGCFWHAHNGCKLNRLPKTRQEYWIPKISRNAERDESNRKILLEQGWRVITVWECQLRPDKRGATFDQLLEFLIN